MTIILGILLLCAPLVLMSRYQNKQLGFLISLMTIIAVQLGIALATQTLGVFSYPFVLMLNIVVAFICIAKGGMKAVKGPSIEGIFKWRWGLFIGIFVTFLHLFFTHHNYSGTISVLSSPFYQKVANFNYPYPYYADEWYAVAFAKDAIESQQLPTINPLTKNDFAFTNFEVVFHSFIAEVFLLLQIDPLNSYIYLAFFINTVIVVLVYLLVTALDVRASVALLSSILVLYITSGSNLPTMWYLIPIHLGIVSLLISFNFIARGNYRLSLISAFLTLLFYPPLIVFLLPGHLIYCYSRQQLRTQLKLIGILTASAAVVLIVLQPSQSNVLQQVYSKLVYQSFTGADIPQYAVWDVLYWPVIGFFIIGAFYLYRKYTWIVVSVVVGILYWLLYSQSTTRIVIEYERVVFVTALLMTSVAGLGLEYALRQIEKHRIISLDLKSSYISCAICVVFLVLSFGYTSIDRWEQLELRTQSGESLKPSAPANQYLIADDLQLFQEIKKQKFLSLPWKGTVIGVATDNYPLETKSGTVSIGSGMYTKFVNGDCESKSELARNRKISFVYVPAFECSGFMKMGQSSEGLVLYQYNQ